MGSASHYDTGHLLPTTNWAPFAAPDVLKCPISLKMISLKSFGCYHKFHTPAWAIQVKSGALQFHGIPLRN